MREGKGVAGGARGKKGGTDRGARLGIAARFCSRFGRQTRVRARNYRNVRTYVRERVTLAISAKETQMRRTAQRAPPSPPSPKQSRSRAPLCARAKARSRKQTNADTLSDRTDRCIK